METILLKYLINSHPIIAENETLATKRAIELGYWNPTGNNEIITPDHEAPKKIKTALKQTHKIQEELQKYYQETENSDIPDIETTIIGGSHINYQITRDDLEGIVIVRTDISGPPMNDRFTDKWFISTPYFYLDDLLEQIKYDRRRIKKGYRVWRSDNPDQEMEID